MHCASMPNFIYDTYFLQLFTDFMPYDSLICTSNSLKKVVTNYFDFISEKLFRKLKCKIKYQGQLNVIPLGVDVNKFKPIDKKICRNQLDIKQNVFVILYYGRISALSKADIFPLLTVLKRLVTKNQKEIHLYICGYDAENPKNIKGIQSKITSLGLNNNVIFLDNNIDKTIMYNAADCFTSPIDNIQETFGITPIEAMACGVPQVVSDWDGYKESVVNEVTGFRIPSYWCDCDKDISCNPFIEEYDFEHPMSASHFALAESVALDLEAMENAFQILIDNDNIRNQMSQESRRRATDYYDWSIIIKRYVELWEDLIRTKKNYLDIEQPAINLFENDYYNAFSHYATAIVGPGSTIEITPEGLDILNNKQWTKIYKWQDHIIYLDLCESILHELKNGSRTMQSFHALNRNYNIVYRSIMYLIKHGFVKISKLSG